MPLPRIFRRLPDPDHFRMSFGDHLEELRFRLLVCIATVGLTTVLCMIWNKHVISFVIRPAYLVLLKYGQQAALQSLSPPDTFMIWLKVAVWSGVVLSSPVVLWQAWRFVATGLYPHERHFVQRFGVVSPLLFAAGVCFMFFLVLPIILNFFTGFNQSFPVPDANPTWFERWLGLGIIPEDQPEVPLAELPTIPLLNQDPPQPPAGAVWFNQNFGRLRLAGPDAVYEIALRPMQYTAAITNQYSIDFYISFIFGLSLAFGIAFQLPIVVVFLTTTGLVSLPALRRARGYVILGITIAAAILTPPDVISQILLAIPMALLYEGGLLASQMMIRNREPPPADA